jgi:hypothetical protein
MDTPDSHSNSKPGFNKNQEEEFIWKLLCSNPIHVFQLILASKMIVEDILPVLNESPSREIMSSFDFSLFSILVPLCFTFCR